MKKEYRIVFANGKTSAWSSNYTMVVANAVMLGGKVEERIN